MILISLRDISVRFNDKEVLSGVSYDFVGGKCYHIAGENGSGKSVLFKAICGFVPLSSGEVCLDPSLRLAKSRYPLDFGIVIDRPSFISDISGFYNLLFLSKFRSVVDRKGISQIMSEFGLSAVDKKPVGKYSLGMKQKLALCQAFMERPRVLLLDEAFNALDTDSKSHLSSRISSFIAPDRVVILTSHNSDDYSDLSPVRLELSNGNLQPCTPQ